jgi:hypothetical protein
LVVGHWLPFVGWSLDHELEDTRDSERPPTYSPRVFLFRAADPVDETAVLFVRQSHETI